jgi:hypothetical protein
MPDAMQTLSLAAPVVGALYFLVIALSSYPLQAISDKTNAAPSWTCWVPIVQIYPFVRAARSSLGIMLAWCAVMVGAGVLGAFVGGGVGPLLMMAAGVGFAVYLVMLLWRIADNRDCSGWLGILCIIPVVNLLVYLYIAFHDGFVRPSVPGLIVALLLSVGVASSFNQDLAGMETLMQMNQEQLAKMTSEGMPADQRAQLEAMMKRLGVEMSTEEPKADESGNRIRITPSKPESSPPRPQTTARARPIAKPVPPPGYPRRMAIPVRVLCGPGTKPAGAAPPAGLAAWCERPGTGVKHGWFLSWYPNGDRKEAGTYVEGKQQGVWTRFWQAGGPKTQLNYLSGRPHGILVTWDQQGEKGPEIRYSNGEPSPL